MKVLRPRLLLLAIFVTIMFCSYVLFCIVFLFWPLFVCLFSLVFGAKGSGAWSKENIFLTKIAHLKLSFNLQFKYMTFMYQKHMKDLFVLFLPRRNLRETVSVRQILNANSSVC